MKPMATLKTTNKLKYNWELQPENTTTKTRNKFLPKPNPTVKPERSQNIL